MKNVTLIAFPFAGGNSRCYSELAHALPQNITLVTHELPGHGLRMREPLQRSMHALVDDAFDRLQQRFEQPYALYGHSFGAGLARSVAVRARDLGRPAPLALFVSGRRAPQSPQPGTPIHQLAPEAFHAKLAKYGGTPAAVLQSTELMALFESVIRADLEALETAQEGPATSPLAVPIRVMLGSEDEVSEEQGRAWQLETSRSLRISHFEGGHFFIKQHAARISEEIAGDLRLAFEERRRPPTSEALQG